jgi:inorganic pyrophosphatase
MSKQASSAFVPVFVENAAGATEKRVYDEQTFELVSTTPLSCAYPYPYGFVVGTKSGDGAAVDCFVLTESIQPSGSHLQCKPVGLLEQFEGSTIDHKVIALLANEQIDIATALDKVRAFIIEFAAANRRAVRLGPLSSATVARDFIRASAPYNTT